MASTDSGRPFTGPQPGLCLGTVPILWQMPHLVEILGCFQAIIEKYLAPSQFTLNKFDFPCIVFTPFITPITVLTGSAITGQKLL